MADSVRGEEKHFLKGISPKNSKVGRMKLNEDCKDCDRVGPHYCGVTKTSYFEEK